MNAHTTTDRLSRAFKSSGSLTDAMTPEQRAYVNRECILAEIALSGALPRMAQARPQPEDRPVIAVRESFVTGRARVCLEMYTERKAAVLAMIKAEPTMRRDVLDRIAMGSSALDRIVRDFMDEGVIERRYTASSYDHGRMAYYVYIDAPSGAADGGKA